MQFGTEMVLVNVKFNWLCIIYIENFENNVRYTYISIPSIGILVNLSLRYTGEINVEDIKV